MALYISSRATLQKMHTPDWLFRKSVTEFTEFIHCCLSIRNCFLNTELNQQATRFLSVFFHFLSLFWTFPPLDYTWTSVTGACPNSHKASFSPVPTLFHTKFECTLLVPTLYVTESVFKIALFHSLCESTGVCPSPHVWLVSGHSITNLGFFPPWVYRLLFGIFSSNQPH